jgi:TonB family protein
VLLWANQACLGETQADWRKDFTSQQPPQYPADAWVRRSTGWQRMEGRVIVRVTVNESGAVSGIEIMKSSGSKILDNAAATALRRWRAKPGRANRSYDIPITFQINNPSPAPPVPNDGLGLSRGH